MKIIVPLLAASLAIPIFAFAQTRNNRAAPTPRLPAHAERQAPRQLEENIAISVKGDWGSGSPIDVTLTGCGTVFRAQISLGDVEIAGEKVPVTGQIEFAASVIDTGYQVEYAISISEPAVTNTRLPTPGRAASSANISFKEKQLSGSARCKVGEEVKIFRSGDKQMVLKVDPA